MNYVYVECSLTNEEIINVAHGNQPQNSVSFFAGSISDVDQECSALKEVLKADVENVCSKIRAKWSAVDNIFICHRKENNNLVVCISSNNPATSLCAVNTGVVSLIDLVLSGQGYKEAISESHSREEKECKRIPEHLIQINASTEEINRRIDAFIQRKQGEVNASNIRDFCVGGIQPKNCARVDAVLVTRKDSKSHVRVRRVVNPYGPQPYTDIEGPTQNSATLLADSTVKIKTEHDDISQQISNFECETDAIVKDEETFKRKKRSFTTADLESKLEALQQKLKIRR